MEPTPILSDAVFIGEAYGDDRTSYVTNFDYSLLLPENLTAPSLSTNIIKSGSASNSTGVAGNSVLANSRRDVYLQVTGIMPSTFNHFEVNVNKGSHFERIDGFSPVESTQSAVIHRRHFTEDFANNVIIFPSGVSVGWGIRAVQFSLTPAIELTVGQTDTREYGYSDTEIPRLSGLRANFMLDSIKNDVTISMTAWDIDRADETAVFVNGNFVGNLSQGGNNTYSARDSFLISPSLLRTGFNEIELVQRDVGSGWSEIEDEKWAVKEIRVETALSDFFVNLVPIIMFLFDDEL